MADIHKRLEKAEKYLQKGKQADALNEYLYILQDDPGNHAVRQTAADLCITLGENQDAVSLLSDLFDHFAEIGDQAKAVVTYKKMARLGSPSVDQTFRYSQFIEKSDRKTAQEGFELAAKTYESSDRKQDAFQALKHLVNLDPTLTNYKRLGELSENIAENKTAAVAFLRAGELDNENAARWFARAYVADPHNPEAALAHAQSLLASGDAPKSLEIIGPYATGEGAGMACREIYAQALVAAKRFSEAEPVIWGLLASDPTRVTETAGLLGELLRAEEFRKAVELTQKLETHMAKSNQRREFIALVKEVTSKNPPGIEYLEYMVQMYNTNNREQDYCETLNTLFQLYYAAGNYLKASDALDRSAEVDPYQENAQKRLEMLRGKIDQGRYNAIGMRLAGAGATEGGEEEHKSFEQEPTVLEDFMLQAEIFLQYGMRSKAMERLERINKLFPREEDRTERLRNLYMNAGYVPKYDASVPPLSAAAAAPAPAAAAAQTASPAPAPMTPVSAHDETAVDNFSRVTEITRNIYRQATVKGVLFTAVNDVGRHFNASRCVAGLLSPGKPPSAALEFCAPGIAKSDVQPLVKLMTAVQTVAESQGIVKVENALNAPEMKVAEDAIAALRVQSLLAAPLVDASTEQHVGVLLLEQCDHARPWRSTDAMVLKTIADQMVLAVNNAKLRSLMKNLAVTDEKSGLLKRSSYLDVLMSETKRGLSQNSTLSVMLLHFGKASALVKEIGEAGVESMMQMLGQTVLAQLRQNDLAVRYELTTIAVLLPDTNDKNSFFVVDKLRKALTTVKAGGADRPVELTVGIAEAVMQSQYEPIDIVTEVINRAEAALDAAKAEGPNTAKSLLAQLQSVAVA